MHSPNFLFEASGNFFTPWIYFIFQSPTRISNWQTKTEGNGHVFSGREEKKFIEGLLDRKKVNQGEIIVGVIGLPTLNHRLSLFCLLIYIYIYIYIYIWEHNISKISYSPNKSLLKFCLSWLLWHNVCEHISWRTINDIYTVQGVMGVDRFRQAN